MTQLIIAAVFVGNLTVTSYRSIKEQTDDSPYWTSIGERVNNHGVAVSQDLLNAGIVHYGDLLYVNGIGFKIVNDCMHQRFRNSIDVWLETKEQEAAFQKKWKSGKVKVWIIRRKT